jgi:hypothetical protein
MALSWASISFYFELLIFLRCKPNQLAEVFQVSISIPAFTNRMKPFIAPTGLNQAEAETFFRSQRLNILSQVRKPTC